MTRPRSTRIALFMAAVAGIGCANVKTGLVAVGDHRLFLRCEGHGSPAVIFEAGAERTSNDWKAIMDVLARQTRVCAYDRAGLGRSDSAALPRSARTDAADLQALLHNAGVPGPYILVGHSYGAVVSRVFAKDFAKEMSGLVLVDSPLADFYHPPPAGSQQAEKPSIDWESSFNQASQVTDLG